MEPETSVVTQTVSELLAVPWPDSEDERRAWFDRLGLTPATLIPGHDRWGTDIKHWGRTTTCWGMSSEGFTGVSWFLWEDRTDLQRRQARAELEAQFRAQFGEPSLRELPGHAGWLEWTRGDIAVELCAAGPCLRRAQLHVTHVDRAEPAQGSCNDDLEWEESDDEVQCRPR